MTLHNNISTGFKRLILACMLCTVASFVHGQEQPLQLKTPEFITPAPSDTAYIHKLFRTARKYEKYKTDSALALLNVALSKSIEINYDNGIAAAYLGLGVNTLDKGDGEQSKAFFRKAFPYCLRSNNAQLKIQWYLDMGMPYTGQGVYDSAIYFYYQGLEAIKRYGIKAPGFTMLFYNNIGNVWREAGQNDQALYYLYRAADIAMQINDNEVLANTYNNIAAILSEQKHNKQARIYASKALALNTLSKKNIKIQDNYFLIGKTWIDENVPNKALPYFLKALNMDTTSPVVSEIYLGIAQAYLLNANNAKAREFYEKGLALASKYDSKYLRLSAYGGLSEAYTNQKEYALANQYLKAYALLQDSIFDNEKIKTTNLLEVKYRTSEKDKEITQKQVSIVKAEDRISQKNFIILIISLIIFLLILFISFFYRNNKQKQRIQADKIHILQQEQEISNLKATMKGEEQERTRLARELHDGIMVRLSAVKMKLRTLNRSNHSEQEQHEYNEVLNELDNTAKELRQTAHNLMPDMILEGGLAEGIFYFCRSLQKNTNINIDFQQYGELPRLQADFEISIYRITQELIQNIVKHARATNAIVQLSYNDELLYITIEDNGIGFTTEDLDAQSSMGLTSIRTRLKALNGIMDLRSDKGKGTTVHMEFDVNPIVNQNTASHEN